MFLCCSVCGIQQVHFVSLLVDLIEDLDFRRIILKDEKMVSMKVLQVMIHLCSEVGGMKRHYKILRIPGE